MQVSVEMSDEELEQLIINIPKILQELEEENTQKRTTYLKAEKND